MNYNIELTNSMYLSKIYDEIRNSVNGCAT